MVVLSVSCGTTRNQNSSLPATLELLGSKWKLTEIIERADLVTLFPNKIPELNFSSEELRVSGNNGCNNISGTFNLEADGKIQFGPLISTKMFCPGDGERIFMETIELVKNARINSDVLELTDGEKVLMRFNKETQ